MTAGSQWYVVQTQPQAEVRAKINLGRQGFESYLPKYQRIRRHARKEEIVARPLFPRYLFVALDLARDRWRAVQSTFGVSQLVFAGDTPARVPGEVIREIRAREGEGGFVRLGLPPGLVPGRPARIIDGIFADARVVIEQVSDARRVAVLLQLLGREVRVSAPVSSIGAV
jgi:transcriptional antiterminator RfaH